MPRVPAQAPLLLICKKCGRKMFYVAAGGDGPPIVAAARDARQGGAEAAIFFASYEPIQSLPPGLNGVSVEREQARRRDTFICDPRCRMRRKVRWRRLVDAYNGAISRGVDRLVLGIDI